MSVYVLLITVINLGADEVNSDSGEAPDGGTDVASIDNQPEPSEAGGPAPSETCAPSLEPVRIIHKEHDSISSFCVNKVLPTFSIVLFNEMLYLAVQLTMLTYIIINSSSKTFTIGIRLQYSYCQSFANYLFIQCQVTPHLLAIASVKEVQEVDISLLLKHPSWLTNECELDVLALNQYVKNVL